MYPKYPVRNDYDLLAGADIKDTESLYERFLLFRFRKLDKKLTDLRREITSLKTLSKSPDASLYISEFLTDIKKREKEYDKYWTDFENLCGHRKASRFLDRLHQKELDELLAKRERSRAKIAAFENDPNMPLDAITDEDIALEASRIGLSEDATRALILYTHKNAAKKKEQQ